jgi:hypothetical protein
MNNEQIFYVGIIEDRADPLMLGRCRVRVVGVHTADKTELPTEGLPWATPIQSITSAATSGIGESPTGVVESSTVLIIFTDPESKQSPMMLGTIGGIPVKANVYDDEFRNILPRVSNDIEPTPQNPYLGEGIPEVPLTPGEIGSLTSENLTKLLATIRKRESSNNYKAVNSLGYSGAYQMGCAMLEDLGYVKSGSWAKYKRNSILNPNSIANVWSGKDGISSQALWLNNPLIQDKAAKEELKLWYKRMLRGGLCSENTPQAELAGLLMVAHLKGTGKGGVRDYLRNQATPDAYGTNPSEYYKLGFKSVDSKSSITIPNENIITSSERKKDITPFEGSKTKDGSAISISPDSIIKGNPNAFGFIDPNLKYPLDNHLNEPDTNRLARNQSVEKTIVAEKESNKATNISVANSTTIWEQPNCPYNAVYPYNHVKYTESGHIQEFDDTPGSERIHTYHRSGTFLEIDPTGTQVNKVVGSRVTIVEDDDKIYITGSGLITIDGDFSLDVKKAIHIEVQGNANLAVHGNVNQVVDGDINSTCKSFNLTCSEDFNVKATEYFFDASNNINFNSQSSILLSSAEDLYLTSSTTIAADAATIFWNSGIAAPAETKPQLTIDLNWNPELTEYDITTFDSIKQFENESFIFGELNLGLNESPTPSTNIIASENNVIEFPITNATRLSPNFTIGDLVDNKAIGLPSGGQHGLTQEQLVINLQNLAINILEPIKALYPDMKINSGFRLKGNSTSKASGISEHELGYAADIGFAKFPPGIKNRNQLFLERAIALSSQLQEYNKLILESKRDGKNWIHISFNNQANAKQTLTLIDDGPKYGGKIFNSLTLG